MLQFVDQTVTTVGELLTKNMQSKILGSLLYQLVDCHIVAHVYIVSVTSWKTFKTAMLHPKGKDGLPTVIFEAYVKLREGISKTLLSTFAM